jgi:hypothetical protein
MGKLFSKISINELLNLFPISIGSDLFDKDFEEKTNLWMINIIKRNVKTGELNDFLDYIVPIIEKLNLILVIKINYNLKKEIGGLQEK